MTTAPSGLRIPGSRNPSPNRLDWNGVALPNWPSTTNTST